MYAVKYPARSLCALPSPSPLLSLSPSPSSSTSLSPSPSPSPSPSTSSPHQFLVATYSPHDEDNEIHQISYQEATNTIQNIAIYSHPAGEILRLETTPIPSSSNYIIAASYYSHAQKRYCASLYAIPCNPSEKEHDNQTNLVALQHLENHGKVHAFAFASSSAASEAPVLQPSALAYVDSDGLHVLQFTDNSYTTVLQRRSYEAADGTAVAWDPHTPSQIALCTGTTILILETSTMRPVLKIPNAHSPGYIINDIDWNPHKPGFLVTAGTDREVRMWDVRRSEQKSQVPPITQKRLLRVLANHTHWIWRCEYNSFYDQLIVSGGTESVNLWSIPSLSSAAAPSLANYNDSSGATFPPASAMEDHLVRTYRDEHEDSIYDVAWCKDDAWLFASLSYDGRCIINHVSDDLKYKLLLQ